MEASVIPYWPPRSTPWMKSSGYAPFCPNQFSLILQLNWTGLLLSRGRHWHISTDGIETMTSLFKYSPLLHRKYPSHLIRRKTWFHFPHISVLPKIPSPPTDGSKSSYGKKLVYRGWRNHWSPSPGWWILWAFYRIFPKSLTCKLPKMEKVGFVHV